MTTLRPESEMMCMRINMNPKKEKVEK